MREVYCDGEFLHSVTPFPPRKEDNRTVYSYAVNWVVPCACGGDPGKCKETHQSCSGGRSCVEQFAGRDLESKVEVDEDGRLRVSDWGSLAELQRRAKAYLAGQPFDTGPLNGPSRSAIFMTGTRRGPSDLLSAPAGYGDLLERAAGVYGGVEKRKGNVPALTEYATHLAAIMGRDPRADDEVELIMSPPSLTGNQLARITELVESPWPVAS